jgi:hypothetical protein
MIDAHSRPGYTSLEAADKLQQNDGVWFSLMRDVLQLPAWMLPAVQRAVSKGHWRRASDPRRSVRENAEREATRMGLSEKPAAPKVQ